MEGPRSVRDNTLIDALEWSEVELFEGILWRVVRDGRDPRLCSSPGGRWDDRTFDVLYTSLNVTAQSQRYIFTCPAANR